MLGQDTSNPALIIKDSNLPQTKISSTVELAREIVRSGEKVIIRTSFKENVQALKKELIAYEPVLLTGDTSALEKSKMAQAFQNTDRHKIVIAIPAAAREGFTLTAANHAIYLDRSFSALDWLQSQDRIHRISQKRKCYIYIMQAKATIDELIADVLDQKYQAMSHILNDKDIFESKESAINKILDFFKHRKKMK